MGPHLDARAAQLRQHLLAVDPQRAERVGARAVLEHTTVAPSASTSRMPLDVQLRVAADDVGLLELLVETSRSAFSYIASGSCQSSVKYSSGWVAFQTRAPSRAASSSSAQENPV